MELKLKYAEWFLQLIIGSNRTFMELKLMSTLKAKEVIKVLIAPLWN